jgi:uncharacterized FlgJ-related protein
MVGLNFLSRIKILSLLGTKIGYMKKIFLVTATMLMFFSSFNMPNKTVAIKEENKNLDLNKVNLWRTIKSLDIEHPEIAFAQALLESGSFTSGLCKYNNNLFGMKLPNRRETIAIGASKSGYAKYTHWTESVEDYALYQQYVFRKGRFGKSEYLNYLDRRYAEGENYSLKLRNIINKNKQIFTQI